MDKKKLTKYFKSRGFNVESTKLLGTGTHGTAYSVDVTRRNEKKRFVFKYLHGNGLGHDHVSDRAQVFLFSMDSYGRIPRHVKPVDVLADNGKGFVSIGDSKEFYFLMEEAKGISYFADLDGLSKKNHADDNDIKRAKFIAKSLAQINAKKPKHNIHLYRRKIRDTVGHGECLMGVLDLYENPSFITKKEMTDLVKLSVDHWMRVRDYKRLCRVHGDFHPGNILFDGNRVNLMDRARGEYGEAADDYTSLVINYLWYSLMKHGKMDGAYKEVYDAFNKEYFGLTRDRKLLSCVQPFFAFRAVVVCNPIFYPDVKNDVRRKIIKFAINVLKSNTFNPNQVNRYLW